MSKSKKKNAVQVTLASSESQDTSAIQLRLNSQGQRLLSQQIAKP